MPVYPSVTRQVCTDSDPMSRVGHGCACPGESRLDSPFKGYVGYDVAVSPRPKVSAMRSAAIGLAAFCLVLFSAPQAEAAKHGPFGLGGIVGDPTGLSGKVFFSDNFALDFAVGVGWWGGQNFHTHVDVLWHIDLKTWSVGSLDLHLGVGPKIGWYWRGYYNRGSGAYFQAGVRVPVGVSWMFKKVPVELFAEIAPGGWFAGRVDFDLDGGLGARYYF